ncbi:MAG: hypothetical protein ABIS84_09045 [Arachnia sp.]
MTDIDDDDLLAPAPELASDAGPDDSDDALADGGVGDGQGIVRIWVQDGRLTQVRVSPNWHTKVGRARLDDCFTRALMLANVSVAEVGARVAPTFDDVDFSRLPRFSAGAFAAFQGAFDEVEQRWDDALERSADDHPDPLPATVGVHKGVSVALTKGGIAERVAFDPRWLETAQAGAICSHVMRAAENAYAQFTPAQDDRSELDSIEAEHEFLLTAFKAMLNPKERS